MVSGAEDGPSGAEEGVPGCSASPVAPLRRRLSLRTPAGGRRTAAGPPLVATPVGKTPIVRWTGAEVEGTNAPPSAFAREDFEGRRLSLAPPSPEQAEREEGPEDEFEKGGQERAAQRTFVFTTKAARERMAKEAAEAEATAVAALEAEQRAAREVADSILALGQAEADAEVDATPSIDGASNSGTSEAGLDTCPATVELGQRETAEKSALGVSPALIAPQELFPEGAPEPFPAQDAESGPEEGGVSPPPPMDDGTFDDLEPEMPELEVVEQALAPAAEKKKPTRRTGGGAKGRATREATRTRLSMDFHGVEGTYEDSQGRRRSARQKFQPLEYWRNEKKVYGRDINSMPTVKEVVVQSPDPLWPRSKPRNAQE